MKDSQIFIVLATQEAKDVMNTKIIELLEENSNHYVLGFLESNWCGNWANKTIKSLQREYFDRLILKEVCTDVQQLSVALGWPKMRPHKRKHIFKQELAQFIQSYLPYAKKAKYFVYGTPDNISLIRSVLETFFIENSQIVYMQLKFQ